MDGARRDALPQQGAPRALGRREIQRRGPGRDHAVELLGEGMLQVAGAQTRLDMAEGDAPVEAGDGGGEDRRCVALGEYHGGGGLFQQRVDAVQDAGGEPGQTLVGAHEVEVDIRAQAEGSEGLVKQVAVLAGEQEPHRHPAPATQRVHNRCHFDGFRPRSDYAQHAPCIHRFQPSCRCEVFAEEKHFSKELL